MLADKTAAELFKIQTKKTEITSHITGSNHDEEHINIVAHEKIQKLTEKERKITNRHEEKTKEIKSLKQAIKVAERDRKLVLEQQKLLAMQHSKESAIWNVEDAALSKHHLENSDTSVTTSSASLLKGKQGKRRDKTHSAERLQKPSSNTYSQTMCSEKMQESKHKNRKIIFPLTNEEQQLMLLSDDPLDESPDSSTQGNEIRESKEKPDELKGRETAPSPTSRKENLKKKIGAHVAPLKAPLSPKSSRKFGSSLSNISSGLSSARKRHSSAGSSTDDSLSISQAETISSDHSDMEIRITTLQEELKRRVMTANKLKRQQKVKRREKLKLQEEALKKQIEAYDNLIVKTKADLEESINTTSSLVIVQPQIKTPKVKLSYVNSQIYFWDGKE